MVRAGPAGLSCAAEFPRPVAPGRSTGAKPWVASVKQRVLGPVRGYYVAVVALRHGALGNAFLGNFKLFASQPSGYFEAGALHESACELPVARRDEALEAAEDLAFAALSRLPERQALPLPDDQPLHALIYASVARHNLSPDDMGHMLRRARERNHSLGVTGMLLLFDGTFLQYIEGGLPQLELIYRIIRKDPMHLGLIELMHAPVERRAFSHWTMAFDAPDAGRWVGSETHPLLEMPLDPAEVAKIPLALFLKRHLQADAAVAA